MENESHATYKKEHTPVIFPSTSLAMSQHVEPRLEEGKELGSKEVLVVEVHKGSAASITVYT